MQKIRYMMRIILSLMLAMSSSSVALAREIGDEGIQSCFERSDRLERLNCYDQLLEFPQEVEIVTGPGTSSSQPQDVQFAWNLLENGEKTEAGVSIAMVDNTQLSISTNFDRPLEGFLQSRSEAQIEEIGKKYDFYAALPSKSDAGEKAVLLLSCQNNITNFEIIWGRQFTQGFENVSYFTSQLSTSSTVKTVLRVRVTSNGYKLQAPRGIEGIRLINSVLTKDNLQISMPFGDTTISTFFKTDGLQSAISLLSRHCSWVQ